MNGPDRPRMTAEQMRALHDQTPGPPARPCPVKAAKAAELSAQHEALAAAQAARKTGDDA
jgi:hypothetical protein